MYSPEYLDMKLCIDVYNNSNTKFRDVTTNDIKIKDSGKKYTNSDLEKLCIEKNVRIHTLAPATGMVLDIEIQAGNNLFGSAGRFSKLSHMIYKTLDHDLDQKELKVASHETHIRNIQMGFSCDAGVDPKYEMVRACDYLIEIFKKYRKFISDEIKTNHLDHELLTVREQYTGEYTNIILDFHGQTQTITELYAWYSYCLNNDIKLVTSVRVMEDSKFARLVIQDLKFKETLTKAATNIIKDLETIKNAFEK